MCVEEIEKALDSLIEMYKEMEKEYGVNLAADIYQVRVTKEKIRENIWYCESGKNL